MTMRQLFSSVFLPDRNPRMLAFRSSRKGFAAELTLLALSGWITCLAFPGFNCSFLAWIAVVPLMVLCMGKSVVKAFCCGLVWGYFWNLGGCFFLREIMLWMPFVFGAVLGVFSAFWACLFPVFCRYLLLPEKILLSDCETRMAFHGHCLGGELLCGIALSAWWVCLDWIRSWIFTGFPWGLFPASQWQHPLLFQICEYTGIYGLDFLLIFCNFAVFFALLELRNFCLSGKYRLSPVPPAACVLVLLTIASGFFLDRRQQEHLKTLPHRTLAIGVVQPNLSQRREASDRQIVEALNKCTVLTQQLLNSPDGPAPELIVWPETAVPIPYYPPHPESYDSPFCKAYRKAVRTLMEQSGIPFLIGTITYQQDSPAEEPAIFNSALLLKHARPDPHNPFYDRADVYSKVHLVPFGEYIPLNDTFPAIGEKVGMGRNLTPGPDFHALPLGKDVRIGAIICYEDVFPYVTRESARNGANLLLDITNDAWYPASSEPEQHYATAVFRTVETRLPMIRCGNSDYSVLLDACGRTADAASAEVSGGKRVLMPGRKKACAAVFQVNVPLDMEPTFYVRYGNVFVLLCWAVLLGISGAAVSSAWKIRSALKKPFENPRR